MFADTHLKPAVRRSRPTRRGRLAGRLLALGVLAFAATASPAAAYDRYCSTSDVAVNQGFSTYWTAPGVGYVGWRVAPHFTAKDRCDHGALLGGVSIYDANVRAKGGSYRAYVSYRTSYQGWTRSLVRLVGVARTSSGWDVFSIQTSNNIGLTRTGRITHAKLSIYLVFNGVPGASRNVTCNLVARTCGGYFGL